MIPCFLFFCKQLDKKNINFKVQKLLHKYTERERQL